MYLIRMKIVSLAACLLLTSVPALSQIHTNTAWAEYYQFVNGANNSLDFDFVAVPAGSADAISAYDGTNHQRTYLSLAPQFVLNFSTRQISLALIPSDVGLGSFDGSYASLTGKPASSFNNAPGRSTIVTVAAAANGFQVSSTNNATVSYSITIVATATIGGSSSGYVVLEIASTNSTNPSDWKEISRVSNGISVTLALTLQSIQTVGGTVSGAVPAGYYVRERSVNVAGTPTYTYNSGQEVVQ